ncbi:hypothetical protein LEMLEM_LOCUS20187, partial [Lemmus lemmus]
SAEKSVSLYLWSLSYNLLCRPGWPQTHRDPPVSASQVLGLKVCSATANKHLYLSTWEELREP